MESVTSSPNTTPAADSTLTPASIEAAARRLDGVVRRTPLEDCPRLSDATGARVHLKREDLQTVRSYKIRGAYNVMAQLSADELAAGVVAASAGNHAQGVAFACATMQVKGRIYVPTTTPKQKCDRILWHGRGFVELIPVGETYDAAAAAAQSDVIRTGATWIHAFDDPRTAAGQGTIGKEILEQLGADPDVVVLPVGGAGCMAGIVTYLRAACPGVAIVGVEPHGAVSLAAALVNGAPYTLPTVDSFVDGAAVQRIGGLGHGVMAAAGARVVNHPVLADVTSHPRVPVIEASEIDLAPGSVTITNVSEGAICSTMLELYQNEGIIAEPAGALAATAVRELDLPAGATVVALVSGGNNDVSRYGEIIERSLVHRGLKHYFLVNFPQEPGALRRFLDDVLGPDDDITLFEYVKRNNRETGAALVGVELGDPSDLSGLQDRMKRSRLDVEQLEPDTPAYRYLT
ncbi:MULTISPECIES: threonine ammonia-lyase IlvA [Gordonia]|uniref:L-threonine dehydratase biosynthetic IlvA n=2 Tax=Gordonia TaxID=2053 RepID=L7LIX2_9ACTN|nr:MULTISPECIES: threonine ammonia-lyase IlvA [Gordonia]AUH68787.1 threonine dehydratase [Gordonia sp. YC-JH1]KJR09263.1 threonine dehydratase [Gordonia sihwensis]KXT58083.1 threonine dehydratase [Gordonia sp. QH-12]MBY4571389.1 threonine dehydratase [Gordonia sihwensis]GAC60032.1 threonine dehydratase [Gordonia sihwensis NBRC 108236]